MLIEGYHFTLKDNINSKRAKLNKLVKNGTNDDILRLSQELDELINDYTKLQLRQQKKSR